MYLVYTIRLNFSKYFAIQIANTLPMATIYRRIIVNPCKGCIQDFLVGKHV